MIKVRASQVFCNSVDDAVAAKKCLDEGQPFEAVAERFSTCPSKKNGGDLGWMPEGSVQSLLGETLSEADRGKILGPVHSQYGYHILKITEIEVERVAGPIGGDTSMSALNELFPEAHTLLFKTYHIGLPVAGYKAGDTVASVAAANGKSADEMVNFLNREYSDRQISVIPPEALAEKLNGAGSGPTLLDIREKWEWDIARINNATRVTPENNQEVLGALDPAAEIVLIDWKQDRSPSFQRWLAGRGFSNVVCLEGGIDAWCERIDTRQNRYDIDEDDGYRYEDILSEDDHSH
jgi:peptidyl-prolyl cis-trans isomerase C